MANYNVNGIDVSKYQAGIDWTQIQTPVSPTLQSLSFAYIKATEGATYKDPNAVANAGGAQSVGLKIGFYHFASLNNKVDVVGDATAEANFFVQTVNSISQPDLPWVLDIESNPARLSPQQVLQWVNQFFATLKQNGVNNYMIYSYKYFLDANLPASHGLGNIPLWIAAYTNSPLLPNGWNNYVIWQYANNGQFKPRTGTQNVPCDLDKAIEGFC